MKLINTNLLYNPGTDEVLCWDRRNGISPREYRYSFFACCCPDWKERTATERALQMYIDAWHAVIRDRVDADALHRQMLKIDEYRQTLADDMPSERKG